jgi:hypothetical protein
MNAIEAPQSVCRVGFARADITPPVGIYHRMWGAATHDRSTGVHRPLFGTAMWIGPADGVAGESQLLLALDHCIIDRVEVDRFREKAAAAAGIASQQVFVTLSHTHGSCWLSRSRSHLPGGELIGPYLDRLAGICADLAKEAVELACQATITYGTTRCSLAAHRDLYDPVSSQFVCGFNPAGPADDTVLVAEVCTQDGGWDCIGAVVNYACHPTTLAWENTLISPDYVGEMRDLVEVYYSNGPCLFLQGASGDLGPRNGYVGDSWVADANGRQLGYAVLSGLEALPPPNTRFAFAGPVVSGAILGPWRHQPRDAEAIRRDSAFRVHRFTVDLPYRPDLPDLEETRRELARWEAEEQAAHAASDAAKARDCRAKAEQMTRQIARLAVLHPGKTFRFEVTLWHLGGAVWVLTPGELYQYFQVTIRARFPGLAVVVVTHVNDWHPGYLPSVSTYGYGIYQEIIAALAPGCLEALTEAVAREITSVLTAAAR